MQIYRTGTRVLIIALGVIGEVTGYDPRTYIYSVLVSSGTEHVVYNVYANEIRRA